VEEQLWLQDRMTLSWLLCHNGAILPRISGAADNLPMLPGSGTIPFQSPPNHWKFHFTLPITGTIVTGMGIRRGHARRRRLSRQVHLTTNAAAAGVYRRFRGRERILRDIGQRHEIRTRRRTVCQVGGHFTLINNLPLGKTQVFQHTGREW
jgi:hypothetical protein